MSVANVQRIVKNYADEVRAQGIDLPDSVYCHMFRRTRATNLYQDGVDIELVAVVLGHLMSLASVRFQRSKNSPLSTPRSFPGKRPPMPNTAKSVMRPRSWPLLREISRPCMKQSERMSRIGSQKKKPINQTGRRTDLTFRVVLLRLF